MEVIQAEVGNDAFSNGGFDEASKLFTTLVETDEFAEFLTLPGYDLL